MTTSTVDKLEYLNDTKNEIKAAIISKGQSVSDSDTFRSYAQKIRNIPTGGEINNQDKRITQNGTYTADQGYTGLGTVTVAVSGSLPLVYDNFDIIGSPNVNTETGFVDDFSGDDYLKLKEVFNPQSNSWEMLFKFTYVEELGTMLRIFGSEMHDNSIAIGADDGFLHLWLSSLGEDEWDLCDEASETQLEDGITYYLKLSFVSNEYALELSTDKESWTDIVRFQSEDILHPATYMIGRADIGEWKGSVDLSEWYIKINDEIWWTAATEKSLTKYGATGDTFLGDTDQNGILQKFSSTNETDLVFDGVENVAYEALKEKFKGNTTIKSVSFPDLTSITNSSACYTAFQDCTQLESVSFPSLETISGNNSCAYMFNNCTSLTTVTFDSLSRIQYWNSMGYMFANCTSLESIYFPSLTSNSDINEGSFNGMLYGCSNVVVHFHYSLQDIISNWNIVRNGFEGTNTTILFDIGAATVNFNTTSNIPTYLCVNNKEYNNLIQYTNYENIIGEPNLNRNTGDVSGFNSGNYLEVNPVVFSENPIETVICFTTPDELNSIQGLFYGMENYWGYNDIVLDYNHVSVRHIDNWNGDSQYYDFGLNQLSTNTKYWFKLVFKYDDEEYYQNIMEGYISTDGVNWTKGPDVFAIYDDGYSFGNWVGRGEYDSFHGTMHMAECYIKEGDSIVWTAQSPAQNSFTTFGLGNLPYQTYFPNTNEIDYQVVSNVQEGETRNVSVVRPQNTVTLTVTIDNDPVNQMTFFVNNIDIVVNKVNGVYTLNISNGSGNIIGYMVEATQTTAEKHGTFLLTGSNQTETIYLTLLPTVHYTKVGNPQVDLTNGCIAHNLDYDNYLTSDYDLPTDQVEFITKVQFDYYKDEWETGNKYAFEFPNYTQLAYFMVNDPWNQRFGANLPDFYDIMENVDYDGYAAIFFKYVQEGTVLSVYYANDINNQWTKDDVPENAWTLIGQRDLEDYPDVDFPLQAGIGTVIIGQYWDFNNGASIYLLDTCIRSLDGLTIYWEPVTPAPLVWHGDIIHYNHVKFSEDNYVIPEGGNYYYDWQWDEELQQDVQKWYYRFDFQSRSVITQEPEHTYSSIYDEVTIDYTQDIVTGEIWGGGGDQHGLHFNGNIVVPAQYDGDTSMIGQPLDVYGSFVYWYTTYPYQNGLETTYLKDQNGSRQLDFENLEIVDRDGPKYKVVCQSRYLREGEHANDYSIDILETFASIDSDTITLSGSIANANGNTMFYPELYIEAEEDSGEGTYYPVDPNLHEIDRTIGYKLTYTPPPPPQPEPWDDTEDEPNWTAVNKEIVKDGDDYIATEFSRENYILTSLDSVPATNFEFITKVAITQEQLDQNGFQIMAGVAVGDWSGDTQFGKLVLQNRLGIYTRDHNDVLGYPSDGLGLTGTYWYRYVQGEHSGTCYMIRDNSYTLDTLPNDLNDWMQLSTISDQYGRLPVVTSLNMKIGTNYISGYNQCWKGSIYLNTMIIRSTINGNTLWRLKCLDRSQPQLDPELQIVGSPDFDEYRGIISEFSEGSYAKLTQPFNPGNESWEIGFKFKASSNAQNETAFFFGSQNYDCSVLFDYDMGYPHIWLSSSYEEDWDIASGEGDNNYYIANDSEHYVKISYDAVAEEYRLDISPDNQNWTRAATVYNGTPIAPLELYMGAAWDKNNARLNANGNIDLSQMYIKLGEETWWSYTPKEPTHRVYDNFLTVGSVNIDQLRGTVTGFSDHDYLEISTNYTQYNHIFYTKMRTGNDVSTFQNIFAADNPFELYIDGSRFKLWLSPNSHSIQCDHIVQPNTTYYLKVILESDQISLSYSHDGINYVGTVSDHIDFQEGTFFFIGCGIPTCPGRVFTGTIDLSETYIDDMNDDTIWVPYNMEESYSGEDDEHSLPHKRYYAHDVTVNESTLEVSGFGDDNYLMIPYRLNSDAITEAQICFTTSDNVYNLQPLFFSSVNDNCCSFAIENGQLFMNLKHEGSSGDLHSLALDLNTNTKYWFKFTQNINVITPYLSTDGINFTQGNTVTRDRPFTNLIGHGVDNDSSWCNFSGTIDLDDTYIKENNDYWWVPQIKVGPDYEDLIITITGDSPQQFQSVEMWIYDPKTGDSEDGYRFEYNDFVNNQKTIRIEDGSRVEYEVYAPNGYAFPRWGEFTFENSNLDIPINYRGNISATFHLTGDRPDLLDTLEVDGQTYTYSDFTNDELTINLIYKSEEDYEWRCNAQAGATASPDVDSIWAEENYYTDIEINEDEPEPAE